MKYCIPYFKNFKYIEEIDEVVIPFFTEDIGFIKNLTSQENLITNKTIIIEIQDMETFHKDGHIGIFKALKEKYSHIKFKLLFSEYKKEYVEFYNQLKEHKIEYFFGNVVRDWDTFHGLIDAGASDIYIVEELGFSLGKLGTLAHARGVSIRVFANVAQSGWDKERSIKSFFIRPEDVIIYENYIDVIEFFGKSRVNFETLYEVYCQNKKWFGPLKEIIHGLESEVDSRRLMPEFARYRLECNKRCSKGGKCSLCDRFVDVAEMLSDKGIYFKY